MDEDHSIHGVILAVRNILLGSQLGLDDKEGVEWITHAYAWRFDMMVTVTAPPSCTVLRMLRIHDRVSRLQCRLCHHFAHVMIASPTLILKLFDPLELNCLDQFLPSNKVRV